MANTTNITKVILLVDIDCFYCQVEEKLNPSLQGKPVAVVQYNTWREGGIIAANYIAREKGVTKGLWCYEAKERCPDILFATVNEVRGRADLTKYRDAGKEVFDVLQKYTSIIEKASVDEAYLDITEAVVERLQNNFNQEKLNKSISTTHVVGYKIEDYLGNFCKDSDFSEGNNRLTIGALICEEIRADILHQTGYKCSAGIAHNKMLAKLASGLHKPNAQTVFPQESVPNFFNELSVGKIKRLGGKFGKTIAEDLDITYVGQLKEFSEKDLVKKFEEKTGKWLYNIARGIDLEPVKSRVISKSIGCCKRFPGKNCLVSPGSIERWINELATEVSERLEKDMEENNRKAKQLVFSFTQTINEKHNSSSKTLTLNSYLRSKIAKDFLQIVNKSCRKSNGDYNNVTFLGISAGHFQDVSSSSNIKSFLEKINNHKDTPRSQKNETLDDVIKINDNSHNNDDKINAGLSEVDCNVHETVDDLSCSVEGTPQNHTVIEENEFTASTSFFDKYFRNNPNTNVQNFKSNNEHVSGISQDIKNYPEYQENISISDFSQHLPKHSVSKSNDNSSLDEIKQKITDNNENKKVQVGHKKRKAENTPSVLTLFKNVEELNEHNSNYCNECNKRIKLEDVLNHDDYHIALQIHQQWNSNSTEQSSNETKKVVSKNDKESKKRDLGNIRNFFKCS